MNKNNMPDVPVCLVERCIRTRGHSGECMLDENDPHQPVRYHDDTTQTLYRYISELSVMEVKDRERILRVINAFFYEDVNN